MYSRENYQKIKEIIENRRKSAIAEADRKTIEVRALSEDIRLIDAELTRTGLAIFKAACNGEDINPIKEKNELLQQSRTEALAKISLPADYTEPHYTCAVCSDSGFVGTRMCQCFREMLITENIKSSGMGRLIEKQSFDNFDLSLYKDNEEAPKDYLDQIFNLYLLLFLLVVTICLFILLGLITSPSTIVRFSTPHLTSDSRVYPPTPPRPIIKILSFFILEMFSSPIRLSSLDKFIILPPSKASILYHKKNLV